MGILDIHPHRVDDYTILQLYNRWAGINYQVQQQHIEQWRQTRLIVAYLHNTNVASKNDMVTPEQIKPLPGDVQKPKFKELSEAAIKRAFKKQ